MAKLIARVRAQSGVALGVTVLTFALILAIFGIADPRGEFHPVRQLFGPEEDGNWAALSIDDAKVSPHEFRVALLDQRVVGGRDGCNDWAYTGDADASGQRMIDTTLQACPDSELRRAYQILSYQSDASLLPDGRLQLASRGHRGIFVRCKWKNVKESGPGWTSEVRRCVVE